jgi:pantoate--beta-alanine ligase
LEIIYEIEDMQAYSNALRRDGKTIGYVPTMGNLHEGHLDLIRVARSSADVAVASVFVNPTQFGKDEDFDRYPRTLSRDVDLAQSAGCDVLFTPAAHAMYPSDYLTYIDVEALSSVFEGAIRPDHFRGVTTIVAKLFNIVKPHIAIFGQKDAQQTVIIKKMVTDLHYDVDIRIVPTRREADGLAMSSRNAYLAPPERENAPSLYRALRLAAEAYREGERRSAVLETLAESEIRRTNSFRIDYAEVVDMQHLAHKENLAEGEKALLLVAARIGTTRLIDNVILGEES